MRNLHTCYNMPITLLIGFLGAKRHLIKRSAKISPSSFPSGIPLAIAEASMYVASMLAAKFSIITDLARSRLGLEELVHRYGMTDKCASIRDSGIAVLGFGEDPSAGLRQLALLSRKAVEEDRAEAICLGCAGMVDFAAELEKELGVPVIDGVTAAVKMAESLVDLRKRTSKVLYFALPEKKEYKGFPDILQP